MSSKGKAIAQGAPIGKYNFSDDRKAVSVYIEMDGLDDVKDDAFSITFGMFSVSFAILSIGGKKCTLTMKSLLNEIAGATFVRLPGKNTVVLKLIKKTEKSWHTLTTRAAVMEAWGA